MPEIMFTGSLYNDFIVHAFESVVREVWVAVTETKKTLSRLNRAVKRKGEKKAKRTQEAQGSCLAPTQMS